MLSFMFRFDFVLALLASALPPVPAPPGRLIDVGGRNLHIYCTGSGSPTIVLEAGGGDAFHTWYAVQPLLAPEYRVCSYDRAGLGFSDARPGQRSIDEVAAKLAQARVAMARETATLSPRSRVKEIASGHMFNETQPEVIVDAVHAVLKMRAAK